MSPIELTITIEDLLSRIRASIIKDERKSVATAILSDPPTLLAHHLGKAHIQ